MLASHLEYVAKEYNQKALENKAHPLCFIDCEIVEVLISIAKLKNDQKLYEILRQWKSIDDHLILRDISKYLTNIDPMTGENTDDESSVKNLAWTFIEIKGEFFATRHISRVKKYDEYRNRKNRFFIIINPESVATKSSHYNDTLIEFDTKELRDEEYSNLKTKMERYCNCLFI